MLPLRAVTTVVASVVAIAVPVSSAAAHPGTAPPRSVQIPAGIFYPSAPPGEDGVGLSGTEAPATSPGADFPWPAVGVAGAMLILVGAGAVTMTRQRRRSARLAPTS